MGIVRHYTGNSYLHLGSIASFRRYYSCLSSFFHFYPIYHLCLIVFDSYCFLNIVYCINISIDAPYLHPSHTEFILKEYGIIIEVLIACIYSLSTLFPLILITLFPLITECLREKADCRKAASSASLLKSGEQLKNSDLLQYSFHFRSISLAVRFIGPIYTNRPKVFNSNDLYSNIQTTSSIISFVDACLPGCLPKRICWVC